MGRVESTVCSPAAFRSSSDMRPLYAIVLVIPYASVRPPQRHNFLLHFGYHQLRLPYLPCALFHSVKLITVVNSVEVMDTQRLLKWTVLGSKRPTNGIQEYRSVYSESQVIRGHWRILNHINVVTLLDMRRPYLHRTRLYFHPFQIRIGSLCGQVPGAFECR